MQDKTLSNRAAAALKEMSMAEALPAVLPVQSCLPEDGVLAFPNRSDSSERYSLGGKPRVEQIRFPANPGIRNSGSTRSAEEIRLPRQIFLYGQMLIGSGFDRRQRIIAVRRFSYFPFFE